MNEILLNVINVKPAFYVPTGSNDEVHTCWKTRLDFSTLNTFF